MKKITSKISFLAITLSLFLFAFQSNVIAKDIRKDTVEVSGNCEMCQKRIVTAATVKGVKYVNWSPETKLMTIKYDNDIITLDEIEQRIAKVGHDTPLHQADDKVYEELDDCCKYDRKE